jgi:mono/diheme cytochrome c family protein
VGEALQYCAKTWQERPGGFKAAPLADLVAYLETLGDGKPLPKRKVRRKPKLIEDLVGGEAEAGKKLTERYCGACHHEGDDAVSFPLRPGRKRSELIARKVRGFDAKGKFKPQSGTMSYYTTDRLSDADLRHIIAYLGR